MKKIVFTVVVTLLIFVLYPLSSKKIHEAIVKDDSNKHVPKSQPLIDFPTLESKPLDGTPMVQSFNVNAEKYLSEAKMIRRCRTVIKTQDELDEWLKNANEVGEPYEYIEDVLSRFERCSQFTPSFDNFIEPLLNAIKLGSDDAIIELWSISEKEYFSSMGLPKLNRENAEAQRVEFNKLKYNLSQNIALTGGEQAILKLTKGYQYYDPDSGTPNHLKSIAYADFGMQITTNNELYLKLNFIKQRILKNMAPEAEQNAQVLTDSLLAQFNEQE